jgi:hypothetical protein
VKSKKLEVIPTYLVILKEAAGRPKDLRFFVPPFKDNINKGEAGLRMTLFELES